MWKTIWLFKLGHGQPSISVGSTFGDSTNCIWEILRKWKWHFCWQALGHQVSQSFISTEHAQTFSYHYSISNNSVPTIYIIFNRVTSRHSKQSIWRWQNIQEDVGRLYENTTSFLYKDLSIWDFGICRGFWNQFSEHTEGWVENTEGWVYTYDNCLV